MGQVLRNESIGAISRLSNTSISIAASIANLGGQQFVTSALTVSTATSGFGGLDTGAIAASTLYYIYLVYNGTSVGGVLSLSSSAPTGFATYKQIGQFTTDSSSFVVAASATIVDTNPVGHVISAMLDENQFRAIHGAGWILADGRSVAGSKYATITGNTTAPDLRGQFLRGKNNARADGNQDPAGERALGNFQTHATAKNGLAISDPGHSHGIPSNATNGNAGTAAIYSSVAGATYTAGTNGAGTGISLGAGDAETRVRNVAVNHFIKIN